MVFEDWLKEFLERWEETAGYKLVLDELFRERLETEYYTEGISPRDAVTEEMSADF